MAVNVQANPVHLQLSEPTSLANHFANPATDLARSAIAHLADFFGGFAFFCLGDQIGQGTSQSSIVYVLYARSEEKAAMFRLHIRVSGRDDAETAIGTACKIMLYARNRQIWDTIPWILYYTPASSTAGMYKLRNGTQISVVLGNTILSWHLVMSIL